MERNEQFWRMLWVSMVLHTLLVAGGVVLLSFSSKITITSIVKEAQMVEMYEPSELPDDLTVPEIQEPEPKLPEQERLAFRSLSTLTVEPTPTPTPTMIPTSIPTQTPAPIPTPTPRRLPTPLPTLIPTPRRPATPTPQPEPQRTQTPFKDTTGFEVPKRQAVLQPTPFVERFSPTPTAKTQADRRQLFLGAQGESSHAPSVTLDQEDAFPFPEYLLHLEEKIAGLWYPNGSGTVSIYLVIARNGKILKSEVDKGEGFGVEKLQESINRTLTLIKRFEPLPREYAGIQLRVRIVVRR